MVFGLSYFPVPVINTMTKMTYRQKGLFSEDIMAAGNRLGDRNRSTQLASSNRTHETQARSRRGILLSKPAPVTYFL